MKVWSRILALCLVSNLPAFSQAPPATNTPAAAAAPARATFTVNYETARLDKNATAVRITDKITIDGHLEEPAWQLATPATDFLQWARPGAPASNVTEARFLYDDDNLYVGVNMWDKDIK